MNLTKTEFSEFELKKKYSLTSFQEAGIKINMLNDDSSSEKIKSGNYYAFGLIEDGKYYWLAKGQPAAYFRDKMRKVYASICIHLKETNSNAIPFVFKIKK